MSKIYVIALMGIAGAGKTSLVRNIAAELVDASTLFSDAYRSIAIAWPNYKELGLSDSEKLAKWFTEGCRADDYGAWPLLVEHLKTLKAGFPVTMPEKMWASPGCQGVGTEGGEYLVRPARYILFEDAWAMRTEIRPLVDMTVFAQVPLDIGLARRLERDLQQGEKILPILRQYLEIGRQYNMALDRLAARADLVVDGTKPLSNLTINIAKAIRNRFGE